MGHEVEVRHQVVCVFCISQSQAGQLASVGSETVNLSRTNTRELIRLPKISPRGLQACNKGLLQVTQGGEERLCFEGKEKSGFREG
jgi:hypothetical protein